MSDRTRGPVIVVFNEFPKRSETFLFQELVRWRRQGLDVRPFSLLPASRTLPAEMAAWRRDTLYLPQSLGPAALWLLVREAMAAVLSPVACWHGLRRSGRLRDAFGGWLGAAALASAGRRLGVRRLHAAWGNAPAEAARRAARRLRVPYTVSLHAVDVWCDTPAGSPRLAEAEAIFVCNLDAASALLRANPSLEPRTRVAPHGLAAERFPLAERAPGPPWRLLCVARFVPKKGLDVLIEACRQLKAGGLEFDCRIVGEGPLASRLRRQIEASGLGRCVRLAGALDQEGVARAMADSHLLLVPSRVAADGDREGVPNVLLEALLTGLPVIATRTGSIEEVVEDGATGALVGADDAAGLAAAALEATRGYAGALDRGRTGRRAVVDRLAADDQATVLARIFSASDRPALAPAAASPGKQARA